MTCKTSRRCIAWEQRARTTCTRYEQELQASCVRWEQRTEQQCADWEQRQEQRCDNWRQESSRKCDSWFFLFKWLCWLWVVVTSLVCTLWVVITTTVCRVWQWITTTLCVLFRFIFVTVCRLWTLLITLVCGLWILITDIGCIISCLFKRLKAPNDVNDSISECVFGWNAAYRVDEDSEKCILRITLKIKLVFDSSITDQEKIDAKNLWKSAIENTWTAVFGLVRSDGNCKCKEYSVVVDVQWVESGQHHTVNVDPGNDRSNMTQWYIEDDGTTAAHESGHMFGNVDEYEESDRCPSRDVHTDNTIMGTGSEVKQRHYERFANWISNRTCCDYIVGL
jgi:hypothetical protein